MAVVSLGVVASGSGFGVSTLTLPIVVDVPRSDPTTGATIIVVYEQTFYNAPQSPPGTAATITDDAPMDAFYNTCYYSDGLNHYGLTGARQTPYNNYNAFATTDIVSPKYTREGGGSGAVIFNPLLNGVNNLTLTYSTPADFAHAFAVAYTGVALAGRAQDTLPAFWFFSAGPYAQANPLSGGTVPANQVNWTYNSVLGGGTFPTVIGTPYLETPGRAPSSPTPYPDYEWVGSGDLLVAIVGDCNHGPGWGAFNPVTGPISSGDFETGSSGAWSWGGPVSSVYQVTDAGDPTFLLSMAYGELTGFGLPYTLDLTGSWASMQASYTFGAAAILAGGNGPAQCVPPPPFLGVPVFHHVHRAAD